MLPWGCDQPPHARPGPLTTTTPAAGRAGWITKVNAYSDGKCITGLKPTYGYNAKGAKLLGKQAAVAADFKLAPAKGEFITEADVVTSGG